MGVMGRSLALNFTRNGYPPVGYDVSPHLPEGFPVQMTTSLQEMAAALTSPRIFFLMVPAGAPVDTAIAAVVPFMQKGDLIIDGGNSFFEDTERRLKALEAEGFYFIGMG
ncbi:MAG TPA: NAD(P)-binding domain-containing protein, partial [Anaerolineaceae bacterium]